MPPRALLRVIVAALVALACQDGAAAGIRSERAVAGGATRAVAVAHRAAHTRRTRPTMAARGPAAQSPGPPPGPGYCWHYIDRSTRAPGFWDMCRER